MAPEQLHVALNHFCFLGLGFSIIPLLIGIFSRNRPALVAGLLIAALSGWSVVLVTETGEQAYERYEEAPVHAIPLDGDYKPWLEAHEEDAHSLSVVMYAAAIVATLALVLCLVHAGGAYVLSWLVVLLALASLVAGILIASSGGKIRRPDFRAATAPAALTEDLADAVHGGFDLFT